VQIPILIEPIAGNGYRARGGEPLVLTAEGPTREAALANLKEQFKARLGNGAEIVPLEVASEPHPLAEFAGMFKDEPHFDERQQAIAENRRQLEEDPEIP